MGNSIILHTHTIMALLLALLAGSMLVYLMQIKEDRPEKKWFMLLYGFQVLWQCSDMIRYSLSPVLFDGIIYKITVLALTIPSLCILYTAYLQFLFLFLDDTFPRGRKIILYVMIFFALICCSINVWNETYNHGKLIVLHLIGFSYGLLSSLTAVVVCERKAYILKKTKPEASKGNFYMAVVNILYIISALSALIFGFFSPIGYWSFFVLIWISNLISIVVFINYAALPTSFQTKMIGFTFVVVMSVLILLTLLFFPPLPPEETVISLTQQSGFIKLIVVILLSFVAIFSLLPYVLKKTLTQPLHRLLTGVQQVNGGDLTTRVTVGQPDEIGDLTQNFNRMTQTIKKAQDDLKKYADNLEIQVSDRTAEVVKQNKQIEIQRDDLQKTLVDLKATQTQLVHKEKLASLGELTAGIAHEIQNPLNFVNNFSELSVDLAKDLNTELQKPEIDKLYIEELLTDLNANQERINHHGKRAARIVSGMLEHSRTSSGEKQMTDINALAKEFIGLSFHGMRAKDKNFNADFQTDLDETIEKINIAPQEIGRVLLNLFNNAFYAVNEKRILDNGRRTMDDGKRSESTIYSPLVCVSTKRIGDVIEIIVKDNGIGIPESIQKKIFQPFFTTKPTGEGTGLGLSLSYDMVTKGHGGELKVESAEGEGAEFFIHLPINK